ERAPQTNRLGALRKHHVRHDVPEARRPSVLGLLHERLVRGDAPRRLGEPGAVDSDLRPGGRLVRKPDVSPHAVIATPERADLSGVLPGTLGDEPESVDTRLNRHYLAA